jgi:hypothetical protein
MTLTTALLLTLALGAGEADDRLLLCRPAVTGDPALARADAVAEAGRAVGRRLLLYGAVCETLPEAARAAERAGLRRALWAGAEGSAEGSRYRLTVVGVDAEPLAERSLAVETGRDPVRPLSETLRDLERLTDAGRRSWVEPTSWALVGTGAVAVAAGLVLAGQARRSARAADAATTPAEWSSAYDSWQSKRTMSGVALIGGGVAIAAGFTIRLAF